jgi:hypothetical protein
MTAMSRDEILTRYRHLRAISKRHQNEVVKYVPHSALLAQARRIGLAIGKTLIAESLDELTLAFDLALYIAPPGRSAMAVRQTPSPMIAASPRRFTAWPSRTASPGRTYRPELIMRHRSSKWPKSSLCDIAAAVPFDSRNGRHWQSREGASLGHDREFRQREIVPFELPRPVET